MPCNACGKVYDLSSLTCIKHPETVPELLVSSGNKLSVAKFLCPEEGCGKSVDVKYLPDGKVNIARYHEKRGERVSMAGGPGRKGTPMKAVTLASFADLAKAQEIARQAERAKMVEMAVEAVKSADAKIEAQLALITQAETRIEQIRKDKEVAEEILTSPEFASFLPVQEAVAL